MRNSRFIRCASILVEDEGKPHTINLGRNCYSFRLAERCESKVTNAVWKAMIERQVSRGRLSAAFGPDGLVKRMWERFALKQEVGKTVVGGSNESGAVGDK